MRLVGSLIGPGGTFRVYETGDSFTVSPGGGDFQQCGYAIQVARALSRALPAPRKARWICEECGSDRVTIGAILDPNNPSDWDACDVVPDWCLDCDEETRVLEDAR